MLRYFGTILSMGYSTGAVFGMSWYHNKINNFAFSQKMISNFEKYCVSFDGHLIIGHRFGIAYISFPIKYLLFNKSFEDTLRDIKLPFYLK